MTLVNQDFYYFPFLNPTYQLLERYQYLPEGFYINTYPRVSTSILTRGFLHQYLPEGFYRNIIVRTKLDNYMCITFTGLAYFLWKNKPSP